MFAVVVFVRRCRFALKLYRDQRRIRAIFEWMDFCPITAPRRSALFAAPFALESAVRRCARCCHGLRPVLVVVTDAVLARAASVGDK